jgi:hypothetical protein
MGLKSAPDDTSTPCQNPRIASEARREASRRNGAQSPGRPRVRVDRAKWNRMFLDDAPDRVIADALGISLRTLKRRKRDRQRDDIAA